MSGKAQNNVKRRIISVLLTAAMLAGVLPAGQAWAEGDPEGNGPEVQVGESSGESNKEVVATGEGTADDLKGLSNIVASGKCSNYTNWELNSEGTLTISGDGAMSDYRSSDERPWCNYKTEIVRVEVREGVTQLGMLVFAGFSNLEEIYLADTVKTIKQGAFSGCKKLDKLVIPQGVETLGTGAFGYCTGLVDVTIGGNVKTIGSYAFRECTNLQKLTIEDGVQHIEDHAFDNCTSLTEVVVPASVKRLEEGIFEWCTSLERITLPYVEDDTRAANESIHHFGYVFGTVANSKCIPVEVWTANGTRYYIPASLKSVTITGGSVPARAFYGCYNLSEVVLGEAVTEIGKDVFYNCRGLEKLVLPFAGDRIRADNDPVRYTFGYLFGTTEYENSTGVLQWYNDGTKEVSATYYIPDSLKRVTITSGNIPCETFFNCSGIQEMIVGDGVEQIGDYAFEGCVGLTEVVIGSAVKRVGKGAFECCFGLTNICVPANVSVIDEKAFSVCKNAEVITIAGDVSCIGGKTFCACAKLTTVFLPESLVEIKKDAFEDCAALTDIYYAGSARRWAKVTVADSEKSSIKTAKVHFAKADISGRVTNGTETISLRAEEGTIYRAAISGNEYSIEDVPMGAYTLRIEKAGYVPYVKPIQVRGDIDLGAVTLFAVGDVNGNGDTDIGDMAGLYTLLSTGAYGGGITDEEYRRAVADVNGDGKVNILDYQRLYALIKEKQNG